MQAIDHAWLRQFKDEASAQALSMAEAHKLIVTGVELELASLDQPALAELQQRFDELPKKITELGLTQASHESNHGN